MAGPSIFGGDPLEAMLQLNGKSWWKMGSVEPKPLGCLPTDVANAVFQYSANRVARFVFPGRATSASFPAWRFSKSVLVSTAQPTRLCSMHNFFQLG
jgi:hypothetical protein